MSTKSRVKKLEKSFAQIDLARGWMPPGWDVSKEIDRAEAEAERIAKLIADKGKDELVIQYIEKHLIDMLDILDMSTDFDGHKKLRVPPLRRFPRVLRRLIEHTPQNLRAAILTEDSLGLTPPPRGVIPPLAWLDTWIRGIAYIDSRLPQDIKPEVVRSLLDVFLNRYDQVDSFDLVCTACGLCRPDHKFPPYNEWRLLPGKTPMVGDPPWYDLPEFFRDCPHCGTHDMMWRHRVKEFQYPWRALAVAELDSGA